MKKEQIQDFTRRISQANRSELTLVTYDMFFAYTNEAKAAFAEDDWQACREAIRGAIRCVQELLDTLDFSYDLAQELYPLYRYSRDSLSETMYKKRLDGLDHAELVMGKLRAAFAEVARQDDSQPLMSNAQQVYAGYTYGKGDVVESYQTPDQSRGFLV